MDDVVRLIEEFQEAVCLWEDEVLIGFDEPKKAEREAEVVRLKEALLMTILGLGS